MQYWLFCILKEIPGPIPLGKNIRSIAGWFIPEHPVNRKSQRSNKLHCNYLIHGIDTPLLSSFHPLYSSFDMLHHSSSFDILHYI